MKDENMDWEKEAPILAGLPKTTPYGVPDQYFDNLTNQIQRTVFLNSITKNEGQGFSVPVNYFEELDQQIKSRIAIEQLRSTAQTDGFTTPVNYFDQLQAKVLAQTTTVKHNTKMLRLWHHEAMKYVAAACFIILSASGLYLNQQQNLKQLQNTELANEQLLYDIDENVIIEHLLESQNTNATFASDSEMESYILDHYSSSELYNNL